MEYNHLGEYIKKIKNRRPLIPPAILDMAKNQRTKAHARKVIKDYLYTTYGSKWSNVNPNAN